MSQSCFCTLTDDHRVTSKHPPGPPMTLGNLRELGCIPVERHNASSLKSACGCNRTAPIGKIGSLGANDPSRMGQRARRTKMPEVIRDCV